MLEKYEGPDDQQEKMGMRFEDRTLGIHLNCKTNDYQLGGSLGRKNRTQYTQLGSYTKFQDWLA